MASKKDAFRSTHLFSKVLGAYNRLLEHIVESKLFSEKDKELLQKIYQKLEEVSTLIDKLKSNTANEEK